MLVGDTTVFPTTIRRFDSPHLRDYEVLCRSTRLEVDLNYSRKQRKFSPPQPQSFEHDSKTGDSLVEHRAMAGNEMDLLKQATQAMMARYDGKIPYSVAGKSRLS